MNRITVNRTGGLSMNQRRTKFLKRVMSAALAGAVMASAVPVVSVRAATATDKQEFRKEFANMLFTGDSTVSLPAQLDGG